MLLHLTGFIGITQTDAVIILQLVRMEGLHVVCIIVMWRKGGRTECPYEYNQHVTVRKVSFVSSYAPSYCPEWCVARLLQDSDETTVGC